MYFIVILWQYLHKLPYLEICTDHVHYTPTLSITVTAEYRMIGHTRPTHAQSRLSNFKAIWWLRLLSSHQVLTMSQIIDVTVGSTTVTFESLLYVCIDLHDLSFCIQLWWYVYSFSFFSVFLTIFVLFTILGNIHRPCIWYLNIVNNSLLFFSFFLIFWLYFHSLPYLEICTDQVNSTSTSSTTIYIMYFFFWFF